MLSSTMILTIISTMFYGSICYMKSPRYNILIAVAFNVRRIFFNQKNLIIKLWSVRLIFRMALLHRFSKLNDRSNTGIFTFIVTRSVTRDLHRDATTKDFYYAHHRWAISFARTADKILGVYLIHRDTSANAYTTVDFTFTLLNREHFSRNEQYAEKQCKFSSDCPAHGINKWIPLNDIQSRNFGDETGEFILELSLSNLMTVFEANISLQGIVSGPIGNTNVSNINSSTGYNSNSGGGGSGGPSAGGSPGTISNACTTSLSNSHHKNSQLSSPSTSSTVATTATTPATTASSTSSNHQLSLILFKNGKLETSYFHFGSFEWNISIVINNGSGGSGPASLVRGLFKDSSHHHHHHQQQEQDLYGTKSNRSYLVYLNRLTGFENACRIQYRLVLGQDQLREDSGTIEQISDMNGRSRGYQIDHHTFTQLAVMGIVNLYFEFYSCNTISEAKVPITSSISPTINCYDRNKQGWSVESDIESDNLKLKLYFMDMHSVPRNHLRYVSWFVYVIVQDPHTGQQDNVAVKNAPHYNYYIQDGIDMGVVMETDISVADIKSVPKKYLENETNLTIHVEWLDSIMLFNHIYNKYDDIERIHCHQMRREIAALANENYCLERQMFAYQKSISIANNQMSMLDSGTDHSMARLSISSPSKSTNHQQHQQSFSLAPLNSPSSNTGSNNSSKNHTYRNAQKAQQQHQHQQQQYHHHKQAQQQQYNPELSSYYRDELSTNTTASIESSSPYYERPQVQSSSSSVTTPSSTSHPRPETVNYGVERSATPVPSSPMQSLLPIHAQQQLQQLNYLLGNTESISQPGSARQSFSGPATPLHHQTPQSPYSQPLSTTNPITYQSTNYIHHHHHHHRLPATPNQPSTSITAGMMAAAAAAAGGGGGGVGYTQPAIGYRLPSPNSNPNIAHLYLDKNLANLT